MFSLRKIKKALIDRMIQIVDWRLIEFRKTLPPAYNLICDGELYNPSNVGFGAGSNIVIPKGSKLILGKNVYIGRNVEIGPAQTIVIDDFTSIQDRCTILGNLKIGRYCVFASNINISSGQHYFELNPFINIKDQDLNVTTNESLLKDHHKEVIVEDDCWIGTNVFFKNGLKIGKGSIIGANSVVTKSIPPYSIVAGIPARVLRKRLDFKPPKSIRYDDEKSFPYFYEGFLISHEERDSNSEHLGLAVRSSFKVAISFQEGESVSIVCKNVDPTKKYLQIEDQRRALTNVYTKYSFEMKRSGEMIELKILSSEDSLDNQRSCNVFISECSVEK